MTVMRQSRTLFAVVLGMAFAIASSSQDEQKTGLSKGATKPVAQGDTAPVTVAEVYATVDRLETAIRKVVLREKATYTPRKVGADRPATRPEIIAEFYRLYLSAKPKFKFTPRPVPYNAKLFTISSEAREPLEKLVKTGFIGKVAPVATGTGPGLTIEEYGDALGFFMARIGDLTHTPSSKWSPYMFNHRDDK